MSTVREALLELVALEDLKAEFDTLKQDVHDFATAAVLDGISAEYQRRKPLAIAAARSALADHRTVAVQSEVSAEPVAWTGELRQRELQIAYNKGRDAAHEANRLAQQWGIAPPAAPAPAPVREEPPAAVWEALQRLIENGGAMGPGSTEDALLVARYRRQLIAPQPQQPAEPQGAQAVANAAGD